MIPDEGSHSNSEESLNPRGNIARASPACWTRWYWILLDPEEARRTPMLMNDYSDEFKAAAMAVHEPTPGATYKSVAADPGRLLRDAALWASTIPSIWFDQYG